jgi:type II secretory pathway pseudopilin PulG
MRHRQDKGETLLEVLLTVIITGLTITALVSSLANTAAAGNAQRQSVSSDAVIRNFAEALKTATSTCTAGAAYTIDYQVPPTYTVTMQPAARTCPATAVAQLVMITLSDAAGRRSELQIKVRTP